MLLAILIGAAAHAQQPPPIVNGNTTSNYESVGVLFGYGGSGWSSICSGTLIHERWVITAAHCIESFLQYDGDVAFAVGTNINSSNWSGVDAYSLAADMFSHEGYGNGNTNYDIGLVKLLSRLPTFDTMPLNTNSVNSTWRGDLVTYVGWGVTTENGSNSGVKRTVDVPIYDYTNKIIYTLYEGGQVKNVCSGDSGGAALMPRSDGTMELVGVISFTTNFSGGQPDCDGSGAAGGSVRVDAFYDWIEDHVPLEENDADTDTDSDTDTDTDTDADSDADSDADADADTDTDTDTDTDVDNDTGWFWGDEDLPARPSGNTRGACSTSPAGSGLGVFWLALVGLLGRRRP